MEKNKRILGALLGLHVGDSLGATLEFKSSSSIDQFHTEITGGGDFNWRAGEATDDTQMMMALLASVKEHNEFNVQDVAARYVNWLDTDPKDVGVTTRDSLLRVKDGVSPLESGANGVYSQGNGSLMRCAALAVLDFTSQMIKEQAAITHAHPNCLFFDELFLNCLKLCFEGKDKEDIYQYALAQIADHGEFYEDFKGVKELDWDDLETSGYVYHTFKAAIWGLMRTDSFEDALIFVVNRGDDADTCGAVCGALCGAYYGADEIAQRWLEKIEYKDKIIDLLSK